MLICIACYFYSYTSHNSCWENFELDPGEIICGVYIHAKSQTLLVVLALTKSVNILFTDLTRYKVFSNACSANNMEAVIVTFAVPCAPPRIAHQSTSQRFGSCGPAVALGTVHHSISGRLLRHGFRRSCQQRCLLRTSPSDENADRCVTCLNQRVNDQSIEKKLRARLYLYQSC